MTKLNFLLLPLLMCFASVAHGFVVVDIATEANTWATYLKTVQSLAQQATMIQNQITQLQYEAKNLKSLDGQQWDNAQSDLNALNNSLNQGDALVYSMSDLDQKFKEVYPGYDAKATTDYSGVQKSIYKTNLATMQGALDQMQKAKDQQEQEDANIKALAARAKSATGRQQALQVSNEIAAEQVAQSQKIKEILMTQSNIQVVDHAKKVQEEATQQKSFDTVMQNADSHFPNYHGDPNFGLIPEFGG